MVQLQTKTRSSRRSSRRNADINITNLMDVMMVLLVVFMVAAPLMTSGIALDLPKVGGKNLTGKETSLNISVDENGYYYIGKEEIPADEIVAKVQAVREANPEISVIISGDTDAQYGQRSCKQNRRNHLRQREHGRACPAAAEPEKNDCYKTTC